MNASTATGDTSTDQAPAGGGSDPPVRTTIPGEEMETVQPPDEEETIPARQFEPREIRKKVKELINQHRANRSLSQLITDGQITDRLDTLAHSHSDAMADEDRVSHTIDGNSSSDRYEGAKLYSTCQFESNPGTYVVDARYDRLELVGHVVAGRTHDGEILETGDEVARAIVSEWVSGTSRDRVLYERAKQIGVGIEVTQSGDVYATGNLC